VQNLSPLLFGIWADKYGRKRFLLISFIIIIIAYVLLGFFRDISLFIAAIILLSIGLGMFKPALQGAIASNLNEKNASTGWGIYFMLLNIAVFFGPALSKYLKEISWEMVFWGSAAVFSLNFITILLFKDHQKTDRGSTLSETNETSVFKNDIPSLIGLKEVFSNLMKPQIFWFIITMSGFIMIYMQFYETLPNFFVDWTDTSGIVSSLGLPEFLLMKTERGVMVSYEWLYTLNSILIIAFIVVVARLFSGRSRTSVIAFGILLATLGLITIGSNTTGILTIAGIIIYTFGEMITNPKFNEYLGMIAPKESKSMYLSYLNISLAIGLGIGSLLGGFFYGRYGEKATMAIRYLQENYDLKGKIDPSQAMTLLCEKANVSMADATQILWDKYDPFIVWIPFAIIGLLSFLCMIIYGRKWSR
jgi:MFS family permease